jgi:phosphatidylglycerol:prolipoprotein diacylglycerol transferase
VGVVLALFLAERQARRFGLDGGKVWNLCVLSLFAALAGSRLLLIVLNWSALRLHPSWLLGLAMIHHPLLGAFGVLTAALAAILYGRTQRLPLWQTADALAAPLALAAAFEQLGALLAGSGYGTESSARWAVPYTDMRAAIWSGAPLGVQLHPVQAYAALAFLALAILLIAVCRSTTVVCQGTTSVVPQSQHTEERALAPDRCLAGSFHSFWQPHRRQAGDVFGLLLLGAGAAIFFTELWRDPEGRGAFFGGALNGPQIGAVAMVVMGGWVLRERK